MNRNTIGLIACSSKKSSAPFALAKDLYKGELFKKARRLMEARGQRYFILSAKYGLVAPDAVINNYDQSLIDTSPNDRDVWGLKVRASLFERIGLGNPIIEMYAGALYVKPLAEKLNAFGYRVVLPLSGSRGIGDQLSKLNFMIATMDTRR